MEQLIQALASAAQTAAGVTGEQLGVSLPSLFEQPEDSAVGDLALPCFRLAKALRAGTVYINDFGMGSVQLPFGGCKQSGFGREKGMLGLAEFLEAKTIHIQTAEARAHWAP